MNLCSLYTSHQPHSTTSLDLPTSLSLLPTIITSTVSPLPDHLLPSGSSSCYIQRLLTLTQPTNVPLALNQTSICSLSVTALSTSQKIILSPSPQHPPARSFNTTAPSPNQPITLPPPLSAKQLPPFPIHPLHRPRPPPALTHALPTKRTTK
ncbi:hypothetical protein Pcinc_038242 [Petrolisthes cinctipes]|uniref:Uncharacterized protein n=1 Tax=Petrolisthes cinctipes TaxID=88211 RepID=A0AAE1EN82_PETCI|nr:hypothetical protein Pcinc_038242 [Petrolisthes cinctipes]